MRLYLVDLLRCPEPHAEGWLVASTGVMQDRHVLEGELGCPNCGSRYRVHKGIVEFSSRKPARIDASTPESDAAVRLAALLALDTAEGAILMARNYAPVARALRDVTGVEVVVLDPPPDVAMGHGMSGIAGARLAPLAEGSLRGAALDAETAEPGFLQSVVKALRSRGRLVAPAATPLPADMKELARDAREWVAEKQGATPIVPLRRA